MKHLLIIIIIIQFILLFVAGCHCIQDYIEIEELKQEIDEWHMDYKEKVSVKN